MTRINVVPVTELTDQHLMAEYRELPMVMGSAKRSDPKKYVPQVEYTLNGGHVKFFYNKKAYLKKRWADLIKELKERDYNIDPDARNVDFNILDRFRQVEWTPDEKAYEINKERLTLRIAQKPDWYRMRGKKLEEIEKK